jgi:hypothetical protein
MLNIREDQMDALAKAARADFHQNLLKFLRAELPEETAEFNDEGLLARIAESERRAAVYEIVSQAGISQFTCLTFLGGPKFDEIPEVREFLVADVPGLDAEDKLEMLIDELGGSDDED